MKVYLFTLNRSISNSFSGVRMAERSKALRSGRSPVLWAWVRIPLLTIIFFNSFLFLVQLQFHFTEIIQHNISTRCFLKFIF